MIRQSVRMHAGRRMLLVGITLVGAMLLAACSDADWELLSAWGEDWATSNGVWDGENVNMGNLVQLGAQQQVDAIFNGPNPALESGTVVDDIRQADAKAQEAAKLIESQRPIDAVKSLSEAIKLRPNDFAYRQQLAAAHLAHGYVQGYEDALTSATRLMERQAEEAPSIEQCHRIYREFYNEQLDVLDQASAGACDKWDLCDYLSQQQDYYTTGLAKADSSPCG